MMIESPESFGLGALAGVLVGILLSYGFVKLKARLKKATDVLHDQLRH